jgi:predicted amidophosphoribosyltransferase
VRRGFNQSALLALEVGDRFRLPVAQGALTRRRATPSQTTLSRLGRAANVRKAFQARVASSFLARLWMHAHHGTDLLGKRVLLIDDVMTTGATANACARALRDAGASEVFVGTVARTHWGAR